MEWFYQFVTGGSELNVQLQTLRNPLLDILFILITFLGNEEFYLIIVPLFYWVIDKSFGRRLIYLLAISSYINAFFKNWFDLPRPYDVDPRVVGFAEHTDYGLPSGHAQLGVTLWGYAAWIYRFVGRWVIPAAITLILLMMFSRLYLGVHFLADVIIGAALGLIVLLLWIRFEPALSMLPRRLGDPLTLGLGIIIPIILLFVVPDGPDGYPTEAAATNSGVLLGINLGFFYEARRTRFSSSGAWRQYVGRYVLGLVLVVAVWAGLRVIFGQVEAGHFVSIILRFIRFALTGCMMVWWAPALFVRLGLAKEEA